jgi:hypothetical protein
MRNFKHNKISVRVKDDCKADFSSIDGVVSVEQVYPSVKELAGIYLLMVQDKCSVWVKEQVMKMENIEFCTDLYL